MSIDFFPSLSSSEPSLLPPEFNSPNKPPALKVLSQTQLQGKPKLSANSFFLAEDSLVILLNLNLGTYQVGASGKKKKKKKKNPLANAGDIQDVGSIPELGRSPGGGHGNPLQYSCLKNPRDRRA